MATKKKTTRKKTTKPSDSVLKKLVLWMNTAAGIVSLIGLIITINTLIVTRPVLDGAIDKVLIQIVSVAEAFESKVDIVGKDIEIIYLKQEKKDLENDIKTYQQNQTDIIKAFEYKVDNLPPALKNMYDNWGNKITQAEKDIDKAKDKIKESEIMQKLLIKNATTPDIIKDKGRIGNGKTR